MRVLVYSHAYVVEANHAKLEHLARMDGVDLSLICPRKVRRELATYRVQRTEHPDYAIVPLRSFYPSHNYRFFYWTAGRAMARLSPDLLHVEEEPWSLAAWQAARYASGYPDTRLIFFTWQNLRLRYGFPHEAVRRYVHDRADAAIAGNGEAADILREQGFAKPIHVLPQFGVDERRYAPRDERALRAKLGLGGFVIGYAGRLVPEKGVDHLLDAVAELPGDWHLLLIGSGALQPELSARIARPPFAGRARILDTVPHDQIQRYLNCMDVVVLPSRQAPHWKEQFGHVLIEAMACERPVLGSTCGEIPNVIADAGLVFPEGDVAALRDALDRVRQSPDLRAELGTRGRRRVLDHYTDSRIAEATHAIHREVLGR
ncbi:glycosyltransferase family 4 protein [bacterium]|nr:glycosyltransferase family 4 protein [bacterium]